MLKQTLTTNEAAHILLADDNASWTYEGAHAIAEYLEELSEDMGEDIEFCHVAIRCEFSEHTANDLEEIMSETEETAEDYIVAELDNGNFIVRDF